ncbi:MAG: PTS sugar transporter subunit IIA [Verrucomicrobia bacterium]|nr:PTS sugar transporter subunit IIA [Verrucomicrobiota bacterium]
MIIILGSAGGWLARKVRLPALCGQIVVGIFLGQTVFSLLSREQQGSFQPIATFALSLVAVTIGGHLEFRRLRNAVSRILLISAVQTTATFILVFVALHLWNPLGLAAKTALPLHLVLASIGTSTSPVSTIHIIKERVAKGLLVKTTIAVIAINNLITIAVFELFRSISTGMLITGQRFGDTLLSAVFGLIIALGIGALTGLGLDFYCRSMAVKFGEVEHLSRRVRNLLQANLFTGFLVAMCLVSGLCEYITHHFSADGVHPSPIMANMMVGLVLANKSSFKEELLSLFDQLEQAIFTCFFVLAGSHFDVQMIGSIWLGALVFFVARAAGKLAGGAAGGYLSGTTKRIWKSIGPMLLAQGAIAIALVIVLQQDPVFSNFVEIFTATVITAVVVAELASAPIIGRVLDRVGETGRDRTRLIEFLQEEFIIPSLHAKSKWDALEQLSYFMIQRHPIETSAEVLYQAVKEREESMSTAIGEGTAVPHAKIKEGNEIFGIMALLNPPLDFDAPDGKPVRLVVMIATPEDQADKHLQVIAGITKMMRHEDIRDAIFNAESSEEIHEIIDSEQAGTFNYFLET